MAGRFGMVPHTLWRPDSKFRHLSPEAQRLYLHLLTNPERTIAGTQPVAPKRWARAAAGLTVEGVTAALTELADARWVLVDEATDELLIRWYMRETGLIQNTNCMKAVPGIQMDTESDKIRAALAEEISAGQHHQGTLFEGDGEGGSEGGSEGPIERGLSIFTSTSTIQKEGTRAPARRRAAPAKPKLAAADEARFAEFYDLYPRHESKADARKAWAQALAKGHDPGQMIAGARRYRADPNRLAEFTKLPATWLRAECWTDDPLPARNGHRDQTADGLAPWAAT